MKYRFIPSFIMLLAGLVCCILSVVQGWPVKMSLVALILVLLVFYIIGQIAAQIIGKVEAERRRLEEEEKRAEEERKRQEEEREQQEMEKKREERAAREETPAEEKREAQDE